LPLLIRERERIIFQTGSGNVTSLQKLDLSETDIYGTIPTQMYVDVMILDVDLVPRPKKTNAKELDSGQLRSLVYLSLFQTKISGTLPSEL
jgi:hypothetical protein